MKDLPAWQLTRSTYEAAALAALHIGVKPATGRDHRTGAEFTEWSLQRVAEPLLPGDPAYITGQLRSQFRDGTLAKTTPRHPFLDALRLFANRNVLLDAQRTGRLCDLVESPTAPGLYILKAGGQGTLAAPREATAQTADIDIALAALTLGFRPLQISPLSNGQGGHSYTLARLALAPAHHPASTPRLDLAPLIQAYRAGTHHPARRHEPFFHLLHALHCLRQLRQRQHATTYLIIRHKIPGTKGAAVNEKADGQTLGNLQRRLNIRL